MELIPRILTQPMIVFLRPIYKTRRMGLIRKILLSTLAISFSLFTNAQQQELYLKIYAIDIASDHQDYLNANIMLLPSRDGKSKLSAFITLIYTVILIPLSLYPAYTNGAMTIGSGILLLASIGFSYLAFQFHRNCSDKDARKLMFGSFIYLLVLLISLFL